MVDPPGPHRRLNSEPSANSMSPYQEDNVRRFGDYVYDLDAPLEGMEVHLDLEEDTAA